jgi:hypothetical protein
MIDQLLMRLQFWAWKYPSRTAGITGNRISDIRYYGWKAKALLNRR